MIGPRVIPKSAMVMRLSASLSSLSNGVSVLGKPRILPRTTTNIASITPSTER